MRVQLFLAAFFIGFVGISAADANQNVNITRFWHNHQPIYWPEWNSGVGQDSRVQYAHDSMRLKPTQNYGAAWNHPHNNLEEIFGNHDRLEAYQGRPRDSVSNIGQNGGYAMSYSGSLIDNIRNLAANGWNYGGGWNGGNTQARQWTTPSGGPRMDMVGFTYHHSLGPLMPKEVFRKEIQIFKEAWWKAWGGNPNKSDHSKGFFPTEMAYSRDLIDVLVDEGYDWVIVASHHISRTSPSYMDRIDPNFNINSSPPNRADRLGPEFSNESQWWREEPNPGQAAWNVSPFAYQLHRVEYVDPDTGAVKSMIAVPSDDVLSYQAGYSGAQIGKVDSEIAPYANDANRPVLVMPSTDGDNAWGGGHESWMNSTPAFFGSAQSRGYRITTIQDFVNQFAPHAPTTHIEEGAWIYPEMCYGSPYFFKWIEPPIRTSVNSPTTYPNTVVDIENGWALKFFAYAPKMAGANWVITAEQIMRDEGGDVAAWKIQAPYDWDGTWTNPNVVEQAWHIYLKGLDSGFQYYGGLGNDDEVKPGLAARRAIEKLQDYMSTRMHLDQTGPTILKPQRFPYNPGGFTFGWFNHVKTGDTSYGKQMPSWFYIWTLAHDVSGIQSLNLKIRHTHNNNNFRNGHNDNLTYAGGANVSGWTTIPMTKRVLQNTRAELNAIANNGQIDYVVTSPEIADHYYAKIDDSAYPDFRGKYFDYYIEAVDENGNVTRTEIQHVFVEDDGEVPSSFAQFSADPRDCAPLGVTYHAANGPLEDLSPVTMHITFDDGVTWDNYAMTNASANVWNHALDVPGKPAAASVWFQSGVEVDSRNGQNWITSMRDCDAPVGPRVVTWDPQNPDGCTNVTIRYYPNEGILQGSGQINIHIGRNGWQDTVTVPMTQQGIYWEYTYDTPDETYVINMVFNNGTTWDSNGNNNWNITVANCGDGPLPTVSSVPATPTGCDPVTIRYNPTDRPLANADTVYIHIGNDGWQGVQVPNPAMTLTNGIWTYIYNPPAGTKHINFAFNDNDGMWDNNQGSDWQVNVLNCFGPASGLAITNPPAPSVTVGNATTSIDLEGIAEGVTGTLNWTNALTGASGSFAVADPWSLPGMALDVGANPITIAGTIPQPGDEVILGFDQASSYIGGWSTTDNRGSGFGPWNLNAQENAGHFIDANGFGLWAQVDKLSEAIRPFDAPLSTGQTFRATWKNGELSVTPQHGIGMALRNSNGDSLIQFFFNGGQDYYELSDADPARDTTLAWTNEPFTVAIEILSPTTYRIQAAAYETTGSFIGTPSEVRIWSYNGGTGSNYDFYFDHLTVVEPGFPEGIPVQATITVTREAATGDSNGDGVPDAWYEQYLPPETDWSHSDTGTQQWTNGHSLRDSFWLGLDPDNAASTFKIDALGFVSGDLHVIWGGMDNRRYVIQHTPTLDEAFEDIIDGEEDVPLNGGTRHQTETNTGTPIGNSGFFRIRFLEEM